MTRAEAVEEIIAAIHDDGPGVTRCDVCAMRFATTRLAHAGTHRKMRGYAFWSHHSEFLGVRPIAHAAPYLHGYCGWVEAWFLRRKTRVLEAGWAERTEKLLLVPLPLWNYLHDMTRRHRREETTVALLDAMLAEVAATSLRSES